MTFAELNELVARLHEQDRSRPIVVGVLGDFSGRPEDVLPPVGDRRFVDVSWESLDTFMAAMRPRVAFQMKNRVVDLDENLGVDLSFLRMQAFHPLSVLGRIPYLEALIDRQSHNANVRFDEAVNAQLNEIIHHPEFQALEASWRGLHQLLTRLPSSPRVRIRVLNISKNELGKTLKKFKGYGWDQSPIFKKIYEEEVGTFGGSPFSLLIGDYTFAHNRPDVELLYGISQIAAASKTIFMSAASPILFGEASFAAAGQLCHPTRLFNAEGYVAWRSYRDSDDSQYLALAMPRVLMRTPFDTVCDEDSVHEFHEIVDSPEQRLWGNPAYFVGAELLGGFVQHYYYASISANRYSGVVSRLPSISVHQGIRVLKSSLEQEFPHDVVGELEALGFIVLHRLGNSERVKYTPLRALAATQQVGEDIHRANIPYLPPLMLGARLLFGLISLIRNIRGVGLELDWTKAMESWIHNEICPSLEPNLGEKIRFPLSSARVSANLPEQFSFESHPSLKFGLTFTTHPILPGHEKNITIEVIGSVLIDISATWDPDLPWGERPYNW